VRVLSPALACPWAGQTRPPDALGNARIGERDRLQSPALATVVPEAPQPPWFQMFDPRPALLALTGPDVRKNQRRVQLEGTR
jgi:hypothetical protein